LYIAVIIKVYSIYMKNIFKILFLIIAVMFGDIYSQELPPIENFTPEMYDADNQNWAISQSLDKFIYVANSRGLLEYNGAEWQLYESPNQTIMRSVHVVGDRIYTGCYMEFGYWMKDEFGQLNYNSLSEDLSNLTEDEHFWKIVNVKQWVLFQSLDRIYVYDTQTKTFNIIQSKSSITKMYIINEDVYFQEFDRGVFKIENGLPVQVINDPRINSTRVVNMFNHESGILLLTARNGFYFYNNNELSKWDINANKQLAGFTIYSANKLNDSNILIGTISNGIVMLDTNGNLKYHINQQKGLQNNTVLSVFQDIEKNIWLGLDNGLDFINNHSPYKIYYDFSGKLGTVYDSKVYDEQIYLGTNQGLFYKPVNGNDEFKIVTGSNGQVWSLTELNGELFCGHDNGTYIIKNNEAIRIANVQGTWGVKLIPNRPNLILQGNYDGLNILEKKDGVWALRNSIEGFDISSRYFEFFDEKTIFVNHEYKGVFKIKFDDAFIKSIKLDKQVEFDKGLNSSLLKYNKHIYYANNTGIYKYNLQQNTFSKDSVLSQLYDKTEYVSGKLIDDQKNKLWSFTKNNLSYLDTGSLSDSPELIKIALTVNQINSMHGYENITHLFDEEYLIGTSNGYTIINLSKFKTKDYFISINTIKTGNLDSDLKRVNKSEKGKFDNKTNNLYVSFSIPEYFKYSEKRYQYQIEGYNNNWSDWSTNYSHVFDNLPYGDYTFKVRGKIGNAETSNTAEYPFTIEKSWYFSDFFIILYVVCGLLLIIIIHLVYRSYYKKQRKQLLRQTKQDLELKELENKQQLVNFKNDTLLLDIENKNRELAISTMSLIKKNEFLSNIKEKLKKINSDKDLNTVIKIIDKNINNTNDWELFEEAFNNADKNFLKKIKSKHASLTSNDLRLCAYLRLNLSSKEIAPLLNISVRSVEVKRYRLRKKMNLEHETSLTDYILEI
jgi:AraC family chitin signaling transcriptional activator